MHLVSISRDCANIIIFSYAYSLELFTKQDCLLKVLALSRVVKSSWRDLICYLENNDIVINPLPLVSCLTYLRPLQVKLPIVNLLLGLQLCLLINF
jgi:hypothetical protein